MSFITKTGQEAADASQAEKVDMSKILKKFGSGKSLKVRVAGTADAAQYFAHSVYKVFYTTPCLKRAGGTDHYCTATDILYKEAKALEEAGADEKQIEEIREQAYQLKAKERYLMGFYNLEDGQPIIVDVTKNQASTIAAAIKKNGNKIEKFAFELGKEGSSTATKVGLSIIVDPDEDLTAEERKHFEATAGKAFDHELFEKVLQERDEEGQLEDLVKFGFDVARLNEGGAAPATGEQKDEELGF